MTQYKNLTKGLIAFSFVLIGTLVSAQTTARILNSSENEVVFKVENLQSDQTPSKILLVYDSNLITLESTSNKAKKYTSYYFANADMEHYSSANEMMALLAVDMEKEMEVEDWMTQAFNTKTNLDALLKIDEEEDIPLEDWMTDINSW